MKLLHVHTVFHKCESLDIRVWHTMMYSLCELIINAVTIRRACSYTDLDTPTLARNRSESLSSILFKEALKCVRSAFLAYMLQKITDFIVRNHKVHPCSHALFTAECNNNHGTSKIESNNKSMCTSNWSHYWELGYMMHVIMSDLKSLHF